MPHHFVTVVIVAELKQIITMVRLSVIHNISQWAIGRAFDIVDFNIEWCGFAAHYGKSYI